MIGYMKFQAVLIYFYAVLYALVSIVGIFSNDATVVGLSILYIPVAYLLHLFAQAHFRLARRASNYVKFCKAQDIEENDKEQSVKFFRQFKMEVK